MYYQIEDVTMDNLPVIPKKAVVRGKVSKRLRPVNVVNYPKLNKTVPFTDRGGMYPT